MLLVYHADRPAVTRYEAGTHDHSQEEGRPSRGLHPKTKALIDELYADGIRKPRAILVALRSRGCATMPSKIQLANYLSTMKTRLFGKHSISLGELATWAQARRAVPDDDDQAFVCGFEADFEEPSFRICISTPRLLKLGADAKNVHADATYKLVWQGYPVLIVGFSDAERKMHPVGLAVTMREATEDFSFVFSSIAKGVSLVTDEASSFSPTVLICDAAPAIKKGFTDAFKQPPEKTVMCWAHVVMNMDKNLNKIKDKRARAAIRDDITHLQLCPDEKSFQQATLLFLMKWGSSYEDGVRSFVEYFQSSWIDQNSNWFEGYAPKLPSTNNGLEALNQTIKRQNTFRERLELSRFLAVVEQDIVLNWSRERDSTQPSFKTVATEPLRSLDIWTSAYQWATSQTPSVKSGNTIFVNADTNADTRCKEFTDSVKLQQEEFASASWETFDEYKRSRNSVWKLVLADDGRSILECNCPCFMKSNACKHSIGMEIRMGFCEAPDSAKMIPLGQKRKRGRPKMAKPALLRQ
jgi:predicted protein tyrosine phosphatase